MCIRDSASGSLERPELAAARWHSLLTLNGVDVTAAVPASAVDEATDAAATEAAAEAPSDDVEVLA